MKMETLKGENWKLEILVIEPTWGLNNDKCLFGVSCFWNISVPTLVNYLETRFLLSDTDTYFPQLFID